MIKTFLILAALGQSFSAFSCELPKNEVLNIGCTNHCDLVYRLRLKMVAWKLGYSLNVTNLSKDKSVKESLSKMDGVLIPGGADIDPKYYMDKVSPELQKYTQDNLRLVNFSREGERRDPFEYELVKSYSEDDSFKTLPMLGICRGFQMMSVAQGLPLYLDIKTELGIKNRRNLFDRIESDPDSLMSSLYSGTFKGFKLHHQGIRVPYFLQHQSEYPQVRVTAFSNNRKIAEAIEYKHRPALGVQFHPEKSFSRASTPVFKWFLTKACEHKVSSHKDSK